MQTVSDIRKRLSGASAEEYAVLERSLCADTRKGVQNALAVAKRRLRPSKRSVSGYPSCIPTRSRLQMVP